MFPSKKDFSWLMSARVGGERHLIFATPEQRELLGRAKSWYIDRTFRMVTEPFYQLLTIHAFVRQDGATKQVLLVFAPMSVPAEELCCSIPGSGGCHANSPCLGRHHGLRAGPLARLLKSLPPGKDSCTLTFDVFLEIGILHTGPKRLYCSIF